jgi:hypothetical protein
MCCRSLQSRTRAHEFVSDSSLVGVQTLRVPNSVSLDFYYPTEQPHRGDPAHWFRIVGARHGPFHTTADVIFGHVWYFGLGRWFLTARRLWQHIAWAFFYFISFLLPVSYFTVPSLFRDAEATRTGRAKRPLVVFSHGLSGTGEEHALMFAHFVQQGFLVAAILMTLITLITRMTLITLVTLMTLNYLTRIGRRHQSRGRLGLSRDATKWISTNVRVSRCEEARPAFPCRAD